MRLTLRGGLPKLFLLTRRLLKRGRRSPIRRALALHSVRAASASKIRQTFVRQILAAEFPVPSDKTIMRFVIDRPAASWSPHHQSRALAGGCRALMCRHLVMHLSHCRMPAFDPKRTSRDRSGHPVVPLICYPCAVECTRDFLSPMWIANFELFQIVAFGLLQLTHLVGTSPRVIRLAERDVADNLCLQSRTPVWPHL